MKTINEYVESNLNFKAMEVEFIKELCDLLDLDMSHIKSIQIKNAVKDTKLVQVVQIELVGKNKIRSDDISKIKGLCITTPNLIEIEVGEIHL